MTVVSPNLRMLRLESEDGYACDDTLAVLTISRTAHGNALDADTIAELAAALETVAGNSGVRALLLQGEGRHFSTGADLSLMAAAAALDETANVRECERLAALFDALATLPVPTIAVAQGLVRGGGVGLVACCDVAVATTSASFCLTEVSLGLLPAVILPHLYRKIAAGALARLALGAHPWNAAEARELGLVARVVDDDALETVLREELGAVLRGAPAAQRAVKRLLRALEAGGDEARRSCVAALAAARHGDEAREGLAARREKRSPAWTRRLPSVALVASRRRSGK